MMSSSNESEPTKPEAEQENISETEKSKEMSEANESLIDSKSVEDETSTEAHAEADEEADLGSEQESLKNKLLRVMADNENLRKRTEREVAAAKKYGPLSFARDLLASLDNLEKAVSLIPEDKNGMDETLKNILIGIEMTGREVASVFDKHGVSKIEPENEKFDYNLHQAMFEVPTDKVEPGIVVQVVQPGYQLHDRLLRPAMVGVSKASQSEAEASAED
jgi:molecular chaperone GrpE